MSLGADSFLMDSRTGAEARRNQAHGGSAFIDRIRND